MEKSSITREVAEAEVNKWLDFKGVTERKREKQKDNIESLIDSVESGQLILNDDHSFTQVLSVPMNGEIPVREIKFKPRVPVSVFQIQLQGIKAGNDPLGVVIAYISGLTGLPKGVVRALDSDDYAVASAIAVFFM